MKNDFIITEISRIVLIGKEEYPDANYKFGSKLSRNELIFQFSGNITVLFDDLTLEVKPNIVRFLPKGESSRYEIYTHEVGECIDVYFQTDRPVAPEAFTMDASKNERIGRLFKKIFTCWLAKDKGYYHECISLLYSIFAEMEKQNYIPKEQFLKIKPAVDAIQNTFLQKPPSIEELCTLCGISASYLKYLFNKRYGMSPQKYITQLKLNHACELLRLNQYTITQVADLCNFSDVYFFSRQFKAHMGITPSEFMKKYQSSK